MDYLTNKDQVFVDKNGHYSNLPAKLLHSKGKKPKRQRFVVNFNKDDDFVEETGTDVQKLQREINKLRKRAIKEKEVKMGMQKQKDWKRKQRNNRGVSEDDDDEYDGDEDFGSGDE